ncbi:hypothetical protein, conserved [Eimeria necatrix]|uniref:Uncharacterized protein n=1 Tax=Eimeria necatrix TaxID=51315 RepID=U6MH62_9EIME|nr:hypothetical protein, conserved [Eimeria necatrix]CDJ63552.1 hypothetical protein, conserved [Eimeria necatrix]
MVLLELWEALPASLQQRLSRFRCTYTRYKFKVLRFDRRTGFFSAGLPMALLVGSTVAAGTFILDKQMEVRYWRRQTVSERELQQQQQQQQLLLFLEQTTPPDQLDNSVPLPGKD